jgi:hypothetical protein
MFIGDAWSKKDFIDIHNWKSLITYYYVGWSKNNQQFKAFKAIQASLVVRIVVKFADFFSTVQILFLKGVKM